MVSQNVRSGGERQRGFDTLIYKTTTKSPFFLENPVVVSVFLSKEKSQYVALGKILTFLEQAYEIVQVEGDMYGLRRL